MGATMKTAICAFHAAEAADRACRCLPPCSWRRSARDVCFTAFVILVVLALAPRPARAGDPVEFNQDVRPILSDRCFACHGPDSGSREADLRLDRQEEALDDRGGYQVVAPGKPQDSELILRITSEDDDMRMPPAEFGKPLSEQEREILTRWIAEGAPWEEHWSRMPVKRPDVPELDDPSWARNAIDSFVLRRLQREDIKPSPAADRRTLVRRLFFDLTGLPPTPEEVQAFVEDTSSDAYASLVDRLLASPHYGERMAMYWLDLVRYADTLGYHGDQDRSVAPYRDYVLAAFNENKPFDQFTIENLAGDLLPDATRTQRIASTYNRLNRASAEGGVQPKEYLAKYAADRVRTTGGVWLGSTLGCCECHDHKFDPFTTKDFYRFAAFFADIKEQGIVPGAVHIEQLPVPTPQQEQELHALNLSIAAAEADLELRSPQRVQQFSAWQTQLKHTAGPWVVLRPSSSESALGATLEIQPDGSILATGTNPDKDVYTIRVNAPEAEFSSIRLELMADPSLPAQGPGRAGNGNFVVQQFELAWGDQPVKWKSATASHSQSGFEVEHLVRGNTTGWAILPEVGKPSQAVFVMSEPIRVGAGGDTQPSPVLTFTITQNHGAQHTLGRFRLYAATTPEALTVHSILPESLAAILEVDSTQRTAEQTEQLWQRFQESAAELQPQRALLTKLTADKKALNNSIVTTLATAAGEPRLMRVLPRGNWMDESGEIVQPGVPQFLRQPEVSGRTLNRLDLARWIVAPDNPLTARSFVNRLWMLLFGQGIARSVDDLGSQGRWPTHFELLDFLAAEFMESGWDVKHLVRLMVMSNTYRQASDPRAELQQRDPYNRLLARQSRWRIDAEMVRDNALAVSGLLVPRIGGPSVKPYQPAGYWAQLNFPKRTYQHDQGPNQYRRGLYTHWQRTFLHPSLLAFDAPVREECTARRDRSNTPLQALVLLNDPTYVEAARVLAMHALREGGDDQVSRLRWIYRQVLQREPSREEEASLIEFCRRNCVVYEQDPSEAAKLIETGLTPVNESLDPVQLAVWTCVARAVLNLHETITRY